MKKRVSRRLMALVLCGVLLFLSALPVGAETTERQQGDVNGNGRIEALDALLVLQHVVGKRKLPPMDHHYANVNAFGGVKADDALWILKYCVSDKYGIVDIYRFIYPNPPTTGGEIFE